MNWVHFSKGALETAARIRTIDPSIPIVIGGQHAGLFAEKITRAHNGLIDGVIQGEAEKALLAIATSVRNDEGIPPDVPGLHTGHNHPRAPEVVRPLDALPVYRLWPAQTAAIAARCSRAVDHAWSVPAQLCMVH